MLIIKVKDYGTIKIKLDYERRVLLGIMKFFQLIL